MYSQAAFSQGNATTWKEAICSKTIRLTLFSRRLGSKRKTHLCLSEETKCHALEMQNSFTETLRIPAAMHRRMMLMTGRSGCQRRGCNRYFISMSINSSCDSFWGCLLPSSKKRAVVSNCTKVRTTSAFGTVHVRTACSWCIGVIWCVGLHWT